MSAATLPAALPWTPPVADVGERKRALEDLLKARRLQADEPPLRGEDYRLRPLATGVAALDAILAGGFPRGEQSEIHGPPSSGRTGVLLALLAHTTRAGALAALVDPLDRLDPGSAAAAGVDLERLLWLRGPRGGGEEPQAKALGAATAAVATLVGSGLFDAVALDLAGADGARRSGCRARPGCACSGSSRTPRRRSCWWPTATSPAAPAGGRSRSAARRRAGRATARPGVPAACARRARARPGATACAAPRSSCGRSDAGALACSARLHAPRPLLADGALLALAREFTPRVESSRPATVLLDLHGLGRVWPTPPSLGRALARRRPRAQASTLHAAPRLHARGRARRGARPPGADRRPRGQEAATLAPLPLDLLDLDGRAARALPALGPAHARRPRARCPRGGARRAARRRRARACAGSPAARTTAPLVPSAPRRSAFESTLELDWPIDGLEPLVVPARARARAAVRGARRARGGAPPALDARARRSWTGRRHRAHAAAGRALGGGAHLAHAAAARPRGAPAARRDRSASPCAPSRLPRAPSQFSLLDPAQPVAGAAGGDAGAAARLDRGRAAPASPRSWTRTGRAPSRWRPSRPGPLRGGGRRRDRAAAGRGWRCAPTVRRCPRRSSSATARPRFVARRGVRGAVIDRAGPWRASGDWWDVRLEPRGVGRGARDAAGTGRGARPSASSSTACAASGSSKASWTSRRS